MKYAFISSMNEEYYTKHGNVMLSSFSKFNDKYTMYLYNEDFSPVYNNIILKGWNLGIEYLNFQNAWPEKSSVSKFSKKGFSIIDAMYTIDCDYLIWIDADCEIKKTFDNNLLNEIANDDILSSHFSVWHLKNNEIYHSRETGFFVLNKKHSKFKKFREIYKKIYVNQEMENLRRFYDGDVYGETVNQLDDTYMNNLNTGKHKTPIPRSILKDYVSHFKGKGLKDKILNNIPKDDKC